MGFKVVLTYNLKRKTEDTDLPDDYYSEFDSKETIEAIADGLRWGGNEVFLVEADKGLLNWFQSNKVDIVFNIAEGLNGGSRESQVPAILDFLEIPYTGSGVLTLGISLHKELTKKLFGQAGIPTPKYSLLKSIDDISGINLRYPLIVKPNAEGSGKGVTLKSVVHNKEELRRAVERTHNIYTHEVLVEEFIEGRELTVGILGNNPAVVMPILEIDFSSCKASGEYFYTWRVKEYEKEVGEGSGLSPLWHCPAKLSEADAKKVKETALKVYSEIGCVDLSRIDIILAEDGTPYVLEVNPLPGLDPKDSNFPYIAKCAGLDYKEMVNRILEVAVERHKLNNRNLALQERSLQR